MPVPSVTKRDKRERTGANPGRKAYAQAFLELGDEETASRFRPSSMETIRSLGGDPLTLVWERWVASDGHSVESCTILTTEPNALVLHVHDRMPPILEPAGYDAWLAADSDPERDLVPLCRPYSVRQMESYPVSPMVNSADPDTPECIERQRFEEQGELLL